MTLLCKKCLVGQQAEDYTLIIEKGLAHIPPEGLAPEALRERRSSVCEACEKRAGVTCAACGCFVELRCAQAEMTCPYGKW